MIRPCNNRRTATAPKETSAVTPLRRRISSLNINFFSLFSASSSGGEEQYRADRCAAEERRAERGKDAGSGNSSAIRVTEDAAPRSSVASARARKRAALGCVAVAMGLFLTATPAASAAAPAWKLTVTPNADYFLPGPTDKEAFYVIEAENVGGEPTAGSPPILLEDLLPAGLGGKAVQFLTVSYSAGAELSVASLCPTPLKCEYPASEPPLAPGQKLVMQVLLAVPAEGPGSAGPIEDLAKVSGGGALPAEATAVNEVNPEPPLGFHSFLAALTDSVAGPYTQAGGHPSQLLTDFRPATKTVSNVSFPGAATILNTPVREPKDIAAHLPPGLIGNPQAIHTCSLAEFFAHECPFSTVLGNVDLNLFGSSNLGALEVVPLFNLQPAGAYPGELGYTVGGLSFLLAATIRSGSDYGIDVTSFNTPEVSLDHVRIITWGVPADPSHDAIRGKTCILGGESRFLSTEQAELKCEAQEKGAKHSAEAPQVPFFTLPTQCTGQPLAIGLSFNSWEDPAEEVSAGSDQLPVDGCNQLHFEPTIEARPTTNLADAPSGFDFNLKLPQSGLTEPEGVAEADLKEALVTLPPGLVVNPSSAVALAACSPAQIGLTTEVGATPAHFTESPANCPDASKLGTVEVNTPLLHNPLLGAVYLATPHQNPSGNLLAGYIVLEGEGIVVKLAGQFQTDPNTGQIIASFTENPQTPFEEFKFHFFEGARGSLRTPAVCGTYETTSVLTPYSFPESGPAAEPASEFETSAGPTGGACANSAAEEPNKPVFHAGTESPQAGTYSPFALKLVRADGAQELTKIDTTLPPGLVGKLAGVAECSDAALAAAAAPGHERQSRAGRPTCPASTEVGTADVAAGAGPTPLNVPGKAYLAGPYKGAPLSLAIITPAVAGPFDLGTVVVRAALYVDPDSAQITASRDPIPTILARHPPRRPLGDREDDRPNFTLNPTNCEPLSIVGSATSGPRASAPPLTQRFQVGGCPALDLQAQALPRASRAGPSAPPTRR